MAAVEWKLREMGIPCIQRTVEEGGISVDQLFFHDPDGFMIEICNCEVLPVVPLAGADPVWVCKRATADASSSTPPPQEPKQTTPQQLLQCTPTAVVHAKEEPYPLYIE
ncbi:hypothetical protein Taro_027541 [Colocasia esculenta]|uniref:Uncharacterized protein n=1 Tax=Colocasia esculenta TaxID=4460 RepID=A0A843V8Z7_COLES|nr:hypothetical protein [Colocasia esculenta]